MSSRDKILAAISISQPAPMALPDIDDFITGEEGSLEKYTTILHAIGGKTYRVKDYEEIAAIIRSEFTDASRIVTSCEQLEGFPGIDTGLDSHLLENIDLAILKAEFGVAENGAVWMTEDRMLSRVLPFISQYLAVVLQAADIVPTMHHAYQRIGSSDYGFGAFIAGPSKTADIEQSLVLGAHGPKGMTVFVMG
ncbi:MAG: LUD domain-containing protein [Chitinophagaceae bacterium]